MWDVFLSSQGVFPNWSGSAVFTGNAGSTLFYSFSGGAMRAPLAFCLSAPRFFRLLVDFGERAKESNTEFGGKLKGVKAERAKKKHKVEIARHKSTPLAWTDPPDLTFKQGVGKDKGNSAGERAEGEKLCIFAPISSIDCQNSIFWGARRTDFLPRFGETD